MISSDVAHAQLMGRNVQHGCQVSEFYFIVIVTSRIHEDYVTALSIYIKKCKSKSFLILFVFFSSGEKTVTLTVLQEDEQTHAN